jgi:hypothetical protein
VSCSGAAKPLFGAGGLFQGFDGRDFAGKYGNGDHLGDFFAGIEFERVFAEVGHEDEDFAAVAGVDDAGGGGDAFGGHGRAVADEQAEGLAGGGVVGFNGDAGADADGGVGCERGWLKGEEVIAEVFAGVSDLRGAGSGVKEFYAKHDSMLEHGGDGLQQASAHGRNFMEATIISTAVRLSKWEDRNESLAGGNVAPGPGRVQWNR